MTMVHQRRDVVDLVRLPLLLLPLTKSLLLQHPRSPRSAAGSPRLLSRKFQEARLMMLSLVRILGSLTINATTG
jgi:hypothetical protein